MTRGDYASELQAWANRRAAASGAASAGNAMGDTRLHGGTWANTTVKVASGALEGGTYSPSDGSPGFSAFLGIPYAAPPVGALRWKPPAAAPAWSGTRPAKWFVHDCASPGWQGSLVPLREDCLYLNVWAPPIKAKTHARAQAHAHAAADAPPAPGLLPVMVFIHGGSYTNGGSSIPVYWGHNLVMNQQGAGPAANPVVVVTLNYRLAQFGFLGSSQLRGSSGDGSTGNAGLQDQRAALAWVRDNIAAFGGDASRVFVFGESAGAGSVSCHLVAKRSTGLFARAGMESGAFSSWTAAPMGMAQYAYDAIVHEAGCDGNGDGDDAAAAAAAVDAAGEDPTVACLRRLNTSQLLAVTARASLCPANDTGRCGWAPVVDGVELTASPEVLAAQGAFASHVPALLGSNANEGRLLITWGDAPRPMNQSQFVAYTDEHFGALAAAVRLAYPVAAYNGSYWDAAAAILTDKSMACPARRTARWITNASAGVGAGAGDAASGAAGQAAYLYQYRHAPDLLHWLLPWIGVCHAAELPLVFDMRLILGADEQPLARAMGSYWANFAATGDPNQPGLPAGAPQWSPYTASADDNMALDVAAPSGGGMRMAFKTKQTQCDFWDKHEALRL